MNRAKTMCNHYDGFRIGNVLDRLHHRFFRGIIQSARGFIENKNIWVTIKTSDDSNTLALSARKTYTPISNEAIVAIRKLLRHEMVEVSHSRRQLERISVSNTDRQRLNINGALNVDDLEAVVRFEDTVNAETTIALLSDVELACPDAPIITIICDNARYYRSKMVSEYLKTSRIVLEILPPYFPNLNLIERFWKYLKSEILYNSYYETFSQYEEACCAFSDNLGNYRDGLRSLLTEKFERIPSI